MIRLVVATLCAGLLASCGGGGGTPLGTPGTTTLTINVANDAESTNAGVDLNTPVIMVGDDLVATVKRALLLFPLDTIPVGANIVGATLSISFLDKLGTPAANLGRLRFVRFQGALGVVTAAHSSQELAHDPAADILVDLENVRQQIGVLNLVQSAISGGDTALGIRIQYQVPTAGPAADAVQIASANHPTEPRPVLEIVIQN